MSATPVFEKLSAEKQAAVTDAALSEFAEHGFGGASLNRLVSRLSIAKGSIFKYFGNKEGLFRHVFAHAAGEFADALREVRDETTDADVFARLEGTLLAAVGFAGSHPRLYRLYLRALFENLPFREQLAREARAQAAKFLRRLVAEGVERGEIRPDVDPALVAFLLDAAFDRFLQALTTPGLDGGLGLHGAAPDDVRRVGAELIDLIRRGLAVGANA